MKLIGFFRKQKEETKVKYLIVGLGNIGNEYFDTRHNIGFKILDVLADTSNISFSLNRYGETVEYKFKGRKFILLKPSTYMNLSGKAISYWLKKEKIPLENLLVLVDDLNLPFGSIRVRKKGSDGGHNGLANINEVLGTQSYARVRFGIGNEFSQGQQIDYVLGKWTEQELASIDERIDKTIQIIKDFGTIGIDRTMNQYNNK